MSKKTPDLAEFQHVPEFAAASPALQLAIVAAIGDSDPVTLYPAKHATLPGFDRVEMTVDRATAARVLAHLPPPFYTTAAAADADRLLTD
jgi:hypothetical protein